MKDVALVAFENSSSNSSPVNDRGSVSAKQHSHLR